MRTEASRARPAGVHIKHLGESGHAQQGRELQPTQPQPDWREVTIHGLHHTPHPAEGELKVGCAHSPYLPPRETEHLCKVHHGASRGIEAVWNCERIECCCQNCAAVVVQGCLQKGQRGALKDEFNSSVP